MEKKDQVLKDLKPVDKENKIKEKTEKELDPDDEMHKTKPNLIQKEDHHLPVDDEVKKG